MSEAFQGGSRWRYDVRVTGLLHAVVIATPLGGNGPSRLWNVNTRTGAVADSADVTLRGTIPALLFSRMKKEGTGMPKGVSVSGDAETGQQFQRLIDALDIDWEEKLSRFIGDSAAHQVGSLLRGFRDFTRQGAERFGDNIREYLQEETEDLPRRREVNDFLDGVDALREDVDRLEARMQRAFRRASNAGIDITK